MTEANGWVRREIAVLHSTSKSRFVPLPPERCDDGGPEYTTRLIVSGERERTDRRSDQRDEAVRPTESTYVESSRRTELHTLFSPRHPHSPPISPLLSRPAAPRRRRSRPRRSSLSFSLTRTRRTATFTSSSSSSRYRSTQLSTPQRELSELS